MKTYIVDIDFNLVTFKIRAKTIGEAKRKARAKVKAGLSSKHIRDYFVNEY